MTRNVFAIWCSRFLGYDKCIVYGRTQSNHLWVSTWNPTKKKENSGTHTSRRFRVILFSDHFSLLVNYYVINNKLYLDLKIYIEFYLFFIFRSSFYTIIVNIISERRTIFCARVFSKVSVWRCYFSHKIHSWNWIMFYSSYNMYCLQL